MIHVKVTDAQRRELEQVSHQAMGRVALRAHMVLLSVRGYSGAADRCDPRLRL